MIFPFTAKLLPLSGYLYRCAPLSHSARSFEGMFFGRSLLVVGSGFFLSRRVFLAGAEAGATAFGALPLPVSWVRVHDCLSVLECQSCIIL